MLVDVMPLNCGRLGAPEVAAGRPRQVLRPQPCPGGSELSRGAGIERVFHSGC